uniref:transglycosylase SLT domain-containing protein n=1 Tax=Rhizobium terrae TaxID=2171756 RepID=UPI0038574414
MASPAMAPQVAFAPAPGPAMMPPPAARTTSTLVASTAPTAEWNTPGTSTILAATRQQASSSAKVGRLVSPGVAPAVTEGRIQPAAAAAIALDEPELTPDMVALQSVIPTPRPDRPVIMATPQSATSTTTLAYAAQPHAVAALRAMEFPPAPGEPMPATAADAPPELSKLIKRYAGLYGVPESLVHRVVHRESRYDPKAYHKNGYWGLMQIKYSTAKSMGYEGSPQGLLDAETNLKYAIKYLRGAWLVADNKNDNAIKLYARGYYYDAKRKDMLHVLEK